MKRAALVALWLAIGAVQLAAQPQECSPFTACGGGGGGGTIAPGANTQIVFNDANAFGADADFTWNKTTNVCTIASGQLNVDNLRLDGNVLSSLSGAIRIDSGNAVVSFNGVGTSVEVGLNKGFAGDYGSLYFQTAATTKYKIQHDNNDNFIVGREGGEALTFTPSTTPVFSGFFQWDGQCRVAADQTNATTTFASSTCTISGLVAGRKYPFRCWFSLNQSTAADGAKFDFAGGTATETTFRASYAVYDTALALAFHADDLTDPAPVITLTGLGHAEIFGDFVPTAGGTFLARFAENASTAGDLTLHAGSWCTMDDSP